LPQPITILGAALCFLVLFLRYKASAAQQPERRTTKQKLKTAKLLFAALMAWLLISLELRKLDHSLDHSTPYEMSMWDRFVEAVSK
jgi:hypothetical protein